ncbi:LysR substrate-binding domain-containing protein [Pandoraea commovens]|uniref:LysR family transcriptional regulator n=1 Tax=Pandoraea commovens TaxID=2508289 RepID=A0A5E4SRI9_9BURK|nr:LysR substrate-binding domain-containing protein [Pandoraea commovens]VVD77503.1 LysR family transcriptional regulator [Pandoraea commovens]
MDRIRDIEAFVAVVETGTFSAAADRLGVSSVMIGKHIAALETKLNARLLNRTTRKQNLTDAGTTFLQHAREILRQAALAQQSIERFQTLPQGRIRVSAPHTLGATVIAPLLARYSREHRGVHVELVLNNERVDLIEDRFDLAVRIGPLADSRLIARPIQPYQMVICGSPEYLRQSGVPRTLVDLATHRCLGHLALRSRFRWHVDGEEIMWPDTATFTSNDGHALRSAALEGAGLLLQPEVLVAQDIAQGRLVQVLGDVLPPPRPAHLVYLEDGGPRPKLTGLVNLILDAIGLPTGDRTPAISSDYAVKRESAHRTVSSTVSPQLSHA